VRERQSIQSFEGMSGKGDWKMFCSANKQSPRLFAPGGNTQGFRIFLDAPWVECGKNLTLQTPHADRGRFACRAVR
jgi:hypothetical protein